MTQQLLDYVSKQKQKGMTDDQIRHALKEAGWQEGAINSALPPSTASSPPPVNKPPVQGGPQKVETKKPGGGKMGMIITIVVVGVLVIGGGVFGYFQFFGKENPETVLQQMADNLIDLKSFSYNIDAKADFSIPEQAALALPGLGGDTEENGQNTATARTSVTFNFSGAIDSTEIDRPLNDASVSITTDDLDLLPFNKLSFMLRNIGDVIYINVPDFPELGFFSLDVLANQWIEINPTEVLAQFGVVEADLELSEEEIADLESKDAEVRRLFHENQVLKFVADLGNEKLNGVDMYHYGYRVDLDKFEQLVIEMQKIYIDDEYLEADLEQIKELKTRITDPVGEVWIGKKDKQLYRSTLAFKAMSREDEGDDIDVSVTTSLSDHNLPVNIEAPTGAITIEEAIGKLFGGVDFGLGLPGSSTGADFGGFDSGLESGGDTFGFSEFDPTAELPNGERGVPGDFSYAFTIAQESYPYPLTEDQQNAVNNFDINALIAVDTDNDGLADSEEILHHRTNPNAADSDNDGFSDFEEIQNGFNPNGEG